MSLPYLQLSYNVQNQKNIYKLQMNIRKVRHSKAYTYHTKILKE